MRKRNHRVQFRLSDQECDRFNSLVLASGLTKEAFVRKSVLNKRLDIKMNKDYPQLVRIVSKILNRFDHELNQLPGSDERIAIAKLMVEKTWSALKEIK